MKVESGSCIVMRNDAMLLNRTLNFLIRRLPSTRRLLNQRVMAAASNEREVPPSEGNILTLKCRQIQRVLIFSTCGKHTVQLEI